MDQLQPIEPMSLDEIAYLIEQHKDNPTYWPYSIVSEFRIVRYNGKVWGLIPSSKINIEEITLLNKARVSPTVVAIDLELKPNMEMFFMAAIRAREMQVKLIERS